MGICYQDARVLWEARAEGASFARTLMIGRQSLNLYPTEVKSLRNAYRKAFPGSSGRFGNEPLADYRFHDYADGFLKSLLGAESVNVMDYSDYEGADLIHDLNRPVPESWHGRYDAVIDGGTLEHVFNFPVAVANLMRMVRPGGRIFLFLPANNLCGHGFYQFSPELMFRVFAESNGFETKRVILWESRYPSTELTPARAAYRVVDPEEVRERVGLLSRWPATVILEARKTRDVEPFAEPPLQSDYTALWKSAAQQDSASHSTGSSQPFFRAARRVLFRTALKISRRVLPRPVKDRIRGALMKPKFSFSNRKHYARIS